MNRIFITLLLCIGTLSSYAQEQLDGTSVEEKEKARRAALMMEFRELSNLVYSALPLMPIAEVSMPAGVEVRFNYPGNSGELEDYIVKAIESAEMEVLFNQHAVTSQRIAAALVAAKQNGRTVVGIIEESPKGIVNYNAPSYFILNNVAIFYDSSEGVNTNCYVIVDRKRVVTGSLDWTRGSNTDNAGNFISIDDPGVVVAYYNAWVRQLGSTYVPKATEMILHTILSKKRSEP